MGHAPQGEEEANGKHGVIGRAWIDAKNTLTLKNRAGRSLALPTCVILVGIVLFSIAAAFLDYGGANSRFWEAVLASVCMGLLLVLVGLIALFLGMIAKHLRRSLWPNSFTAVSEAEDWFENAVDDETGAEDPPMTDEQREMLRKL